MAKHTVCIKTVVNVIVEDVEADSYLEALKRAESKINFETLFNDNGAYAGSDRTGWGEAHTHAIVDKKPDDYDHYFKWKDDGTWENVDTKSEDSNLGVEAHTCPECSMLPPHRICWEDAGGMNRWNDGEKKT